MKNKSEYQEELETICQKAAANSRELERLYRKSNTKFPPILQFRPQLLHQISHSLSPSSPLPNPDNSGFCNIVFDRKIKNHNPGIGEAAPYKPDIYQHLQKNILIKEEGKRPERLRLDRVGGQQTLRTTRGRLFGPSLFGRKSSSFREHSQTDLDSLANQVSHFSVREPTQPEELLLTLQRSKANLNAQGPIVSHRKRGQTIDLAKLTIYPRGDGFLRHRPQKASLLEGGGSLQPWKLQEQEWSAQNCPE